MRRWTTWRSEWVKKWKFEHAKKVFSRAPKEETVAVETNLEVK
jgi:hypothetical protein